MSSNTSISDDQTDGSINTEYFTASSNYIVGGTAEDVASIKIGLSIDIDTVISCVDDISTCDGSGKIKCTSCEQNIKTDEVTACYTSNTGNNYNQSCNNTDSRNDDTLDTNNDSYDHYFDCEEREDQFVHPNVEETKAFEEALLFNSDILFKVVSHLPSIDLLSLALTSKRFSTSKSLLTTVIEPSLIEESASIVIHEIATEEQLATLPYYNGQNSLANYHYLQFMRGPLTFDQLVGGVEYVDSRDKSCVTNSGNNWDTAFSNNILMAGKHYVTFEVSSSSSPPLPFIYIGVMRPGQVNQNASGAPDEREFFQNFSRRLGGECIENSKVQCCMYSTDNGVCYSSDWICYSSIWRDSNEDITWNRSWDEIESITSGDVIGMLLDLDEGTLSVYKNGRKLGVMKRGLVGPYCWMTTIWKGSSVTIKRGTVPPS